ncbi:hypothetical protein [Zafaria cholistanensis]|uniref:hypothetical protein n=1 Tax=Zafaria cholistanensis TaxID=1682741 RepID=UPI0012304AB3|nr:hypothetical protein [Zafaria cholistanensis]
MNIKGIKGEVARLLQQAAGNRAAISAFGDQWVLRSPTGRQQVLADLDDLAAALAAGGTMDSDRLRKLAGTQDAPDADGRFDLIRSLPVDGPLPEMTAAEFTLALLAHADRRQRM